MEHSMEHSTEDSMECSMVSDQVMEALICVRVLNDNHTTRRELWQENVIMCQGV